MLERVKEAIANRPPGSRLVFLSDYDGTLTDFHENPAMPWPSSDTLRLISRLARRPDVSLGFVSGRRLEDLRARTTLSEDPYLAEHTYLAGLHGLEIACNGQRWQHPRLEAARDQMRGLAASLEALAMGVNGLLIENKGVSVAAHVRGVPEADREKALSLVDHDAEPWIAAGSARRLWGNLVLEFLPSVAWHKGDATRWIVEDVERRSGAPAWVVFVGDDVTDEDAFRSIERGIGVLVGQRESAARFQLDSPKDVAALLAWLTRDA
jgi:trehalose-phosphatase